MMWPFWCYKHTVMKTLITILIVAYISRYDINRIQVIRESADTVYIFKATKHSCNWKGCTLKGQIIFSSPFNKTTRPYHFDLIHFNNPAWNRAEVDKQLRMNELFGTI